jgi:AAA domain
VLRPARCRKTLSACRYASWHEVDPLLRASTRHYSEGRDRADWHTLLYTPTVSATPRMIDKELTTMAWEFSKIRTPDPFDRRTYESPHAITPFAELLIVDEADRLKTPALEQLRDHYDRSRLGMILIGMPGIEKRLARYPQLYSRIGFVHEYRPLSAVELIFVLQHHWAGLGLTPVGQRLHQHRGARGGRPHHRRQLPPRPAAVRPGTADHGDQQAEHHHQRGHRGSPRVPRHRHHLKAVPAAGQRA